MDISLMIFIGIFVFAGVITIVVNILYRRKREKERREYFSKSNLEAYEHQLSDFLAEYNIKDEENIPAILKKVGYDLKEDNLPNNREAIIKDKIIYVDSGLSYRVKNFGVAHELAHIIRGSEERAARDSHSFKSRSIEEQICDYLAAALLLPFSEISRRMKDANYNTINQRKKIKFISNLAKEKNVCEEVVIRRIEEIKVLEGI